VIARPYDKIKAGNVLMYYPEANVLVTRAVDPASRTPAFKNVAVTVEPMPAPANGDLPTMAIMAAGEPETNPSSRAGMRAC
jgi:predicted molibdopterin-dependent oxidoreductase YjgC